MIGSKRYETRFIWPLLLAVAVALYSTGCHDESGITKTWCDDCAEEDTEEMALNFQTDAALNGRRIDSSADYTYGTYKDADPDGSGGVVDGTGTPNTAEIRRDWDGFRQAALELGDITPSGDPDTALDSQTLEGLLNQYGGGFTFRTVADPTTSHKADLSEDGLLTESAEDGSAFSFQANVRDGVIEFTRQSSTVSNVKYTVLEYEVAYTAPTTGSGFVQFTTDLTLPDIAAGKKVYGVTVYPPGSGGIGVPVSWNTADDGGLLQIQNMKGVQPVAALPGAGGVAMVSVMVDPL